MVKPAKRGGSESTKNVTEEVKNQVSSRNRRSLGSISNKDHDKHNKEFKVSIRRLVCVKFCESLRPTPSRSKSLKRRIYVYVHIETDTSISTYICLDV